MEHNGMKFISRQRSVHINLEKGVRCYLGTKFICWEAVWGESFGAQRVIKSCKRRTRLALNALNEA